MGSADPTDGKPRPEPQHRRGWVAGVGAGRGRTVYERADPLVGDHLEPVHRERRQPGASLGPEDTIKRRESDTPPEYMHPVSMGTLVEVVTRRGWGGIELNN